jgi:hypothetical protein
LLNPTMPSSGMDRQAYLIGKFGNACQGRLWPYCRRRS